MTTTPLVTVIMTVFNGEAYLAQAIDSIRRQTWHDFEFIIVDDGSTDRTPEILTQAQIDPRLKIITQPRAGRARALNRAWREACGCYIANLDADDVAEPERLAKQVAFLRSHPEIGLVGTACTIVEGDTFSGLIQRHPLNDSKLRQALVRMNPFVHSSVMMRRAVLEKTGGYNENLRIAVDHDLWVRLAGYCQIANLPESLTLKRMHPQAYFQQRSLTWEKCQTRIVIRWQAWFAFSRSIVELRYVIIEPLVRWLYGRVRAFVNCSKSHKT